MQEKSLREILRFFRGVIPAPDIGVKGIPIDSVEITERCLETGELALGGTYYDTPPSRMESVLIVAE